MSILATRPATGQIDTQPAPRCYLAWCSDCFTVPIPGDFSVYHTGAEETVDLARVCAAPGHTWTVKGSATVELVRMDYEVPGEPMTGDTIVHLRFGKSDGPEMTAEAAIALGELLIGHARMAIADRAQTSPAVTR